MEEEDKYLGYFRTRAFHELHGELKSSNPFITHQFIKSWKDGSILVGNQRKHVTEDIILEATGLDTEGINFYRDRKLLDCDVEEFAETTKEHNRLVNITNAYFSPSSISRPWRFTMFVVIEYLTLDEYFTKIFGHNFMLVNHFRHRVRLNLPFQLQQSLGNTILAIQNNPEGDHACHEGLMALFMNLLKSKKVDRPHFSKKNLECDIEGSEQDKGNNEDTQEGYDEMEVKKRNKLSPRSSSMKKRKNKEVDSEMDTKSEEEPKKRIGKKITGNFGIATINKGKKNVGFQTFPLMMNL